VLFKSEGNLKTTKMGKFSHFYNLETRLGLSIFFQSEDSSQTKTWGKFGHFLSLLTHSGWSSVL
jgi:hypothetical protein